MPTRLQRNGFVRWTLRVLLLFVSSELMLHVSTWVLERTTGAASAAAASSGGIVCIGDSNTFGIGAPTGRSYPDQLRERLKAERDLRDVTNLGVSGFPSQRIVDKLQRFVEGGTKPSVVLFLGGTNDAWQEDVVLETDPVQPGFGARLLSWMEHLRTVRVAEAAFHVLRGDVAGPESGGALCDLPAPSDVNYKEWNGEYARAAKAGARGILPWLHFFHFCELPAQADRALRDLAARPEFERVRPRLRFPFDQYQWEIEVLAGRDPAPLATEGLKGPPCSFAKYTAIWADLRARRMANVRDALQSLRKDENFADPPSAAFVALLEAWISLIDRDYARADREFTALLPQLVGQGAPVGLYHALAGAALARLLKDDSTRLEGFRKEQHDWDKRYTYNSSPLGHEAMVSAVWIDALKSGAEEACRKREGEARSRFGAEPHSDMLKWLYAHPRASLDEVRREIPFDVPRTTWLVPNKGYLVAQQKKSGEDSLRASTDRLDALSMKYGFKVIVLTYLDYESPINDLLRAIAAAHRWTLVDMHKIYPREQLSADDKKKYFCPDRGHPNETGYGIFAQAVFDELAREGLKR